MKGSACERVQRWRGGRRREKERGNKARELRGGGAARGGRGGRGDAPRAEGERDALKEVDGEGRPRAAAEQGKATPATRTDGRAHGRPGGRRRPRHHWTPPRPPRPASKASPGYAGLARRWPGDRRQPTSRKHPRGGRVGGRVGRAEGLVAAAALRGEPFFVPAAPCAPCACAAPSATTATGPARFLNKPTRTGVVFGVGGGSAVAAAGPPARQPARPSARPRRPRRPTSATLPVSEVRVIVPVSAECSAMAATRPAGPPAAARRRPLD